MEMHEKNNDNHEKIMNEKESEGWDLKFQNYWGYIITAGTNFE